MTVTFHKAQRGNIGLLIMLAGGTGSGKTWSAMELAQGMAGGDRFAVCDTERGRASMYADTFDFDVFELDAPFSPSRYLDVVLSAEAKGFPVLVIDSMSHEWEGPGGLLEQHEEGMKDDKGRVVQAKNLSAWIAPKMEHRKFVNRLLQAKPHVIMCFRAAERVEVERDPRTGKMEIVPKKSLTGLEGWLPITEKNLPFEATASFMLMAKQPGVPLPIKLPEPLKPLVPVGKPLSAQTGAALVGWASGKASPNGHGTAVQRKPPGKPLDDETFRALLAARMEAEVDTAWLRAHLEEIDVQDIPQRIGQAFIRSLSEEQGQKLLSALNAIVDERAAAGASA